MIRIQNALSACQIETYLALRFPWHIDQPINVGAHHSSLSGHRRHLLELVELRIGFVQRFSCEAGVVDAFSQLIKFIVAFFAITKLFLNGLHLLIQVVLALAALHLLLDPTADALLNLQQVDFRIQQRQNMLNPSSQIGNFQNFLLLLDLQHHVCRHGVD